MLSKLQSLNHFTLLLLFFLTLNLIQAQNVQAQKPVEIYVTSWCPHCRSLEKFLKEQHISFQKYDIEKDPAAAKRHQALGGGGIPVIKIGPTILRGFDPNQILQILGKPAPFGFPQV